MKKIDKVLDASESILSALCGVLLFWMFFALLVQVVARYVFRSGFAWTEETARYAMVMTAFIGAAICTKQGSHVVIDAVETFLPKIKPVLKVIQTLVMIAYSVVVFILGIMALPTAARQTSPNCRIPMNIIYMVFPIAMVFFFVYSIRKLIAIFRNEEYGSGDTEVDDALAAVEKEFGGKENDA